MALLPPILYDPRLHHHLLPQLAQIHADCVLQDGTLATFLPDPETKRLDLEKLTEYWNSYSSQVEAGTRAIVLQVSPPDQQGDQDVAGVVTLWMPETETGPFRAEIHKLLVSPRHRMKGVARAVMGLMEQVALTHQRGLLTVDTTLGSGAEFVYPKLGYIEVGRIPKYGIHPLTRELMDEVWFYKDLRQD